MQLGPKVISELAALDVAKLDNKKKVKVTGETLKILLAAAQINKCVSLGLSMAIESIYSENDIEPTAFVHSVLNHANEAANIETVSEAQMKLNDLVNLLGK